MRGQLDAASAAGSLWRDSCAPMEPLPRLAGDERAEIVVVGAGYTGLSAALHAVCGGRDVVVLEARELGEGGSGLNGGQVIAGLKHDPDTLEQMYGERSGAQVAACCGTAPDLVFELIKEHAIECDAVRTGWLQLTASERQLKGLERRAAQWRSRGADVAVVSAREAADLTGTARYCGGWIDRRGGTVQPLAYLRGLARIARARGARLFTRTPVTHLTRRENAWLVHTARGAVRAQTVIVATDAYTDGAFDELRRTMVAVPSIQVATAPLPPRLRAAVLPGGQSVSDTQRILRYFRLDAAGRFVIGTRGSYADVPVPTRTPTHEQAVRELYPDLAAVPLQYRWGGFVAMTRDGLPHLHEPAPGLLAGMGYNGRGVAMATTLGRLLARRALGEPAETLGFPTTPVRPIRAHGLSRVAARAAIRYLQARDALERALARSRGAPA